MCLVYSPRWKRPRHLLGALWLRKQQRGVLTMNLTATLVGVACLHFELLYSDFLPYFYQWWWQYQEGVKNVYIWHSEGRVREQAHERKPGILLFICTEQRFSLSACIIPCLFLQERLEMGKRPARSPLLDKLRTMKSDTNWFKPPCCFSIWGAWESIRPLPGYSAFCSAFRSHHYSPLLRTSCYYRH